MVETTEQNISCPYCACITTVKFGSYKGEPRYWCKICRRKFKNDGAPFGMKTNAKIVASALTMHHDGMSQSAIRNQLGNVYGVRPSRSTIWQWIQEYTGTQTPDI